MQIVGIGFLYNTFNKSISSFRSNFQQSFPEQMYIPYI